MAKREAFFALSQTYVVEWIHRHCSGGSLHREEDKTATRSILPFLQTGQVMTSTPQILSNCSCQDSVLFFSFVTVLHVPRNSRHKEMLSLRFLFANRPK